MTTTNGEITLPTNYQSFIHMSRYSRWLEGEQRRETWEETVDRYLSFMAQHLGDNHSYDLYGKELEELRDAMLTLKVLGSMRALMTAGPALKRENVAGYNCLSVSTSTTCPPYLIKSLRIQTT